MRKSIFIKNFILILTGSEILLEVKNNNITIKPFLENFLNPNSYNFRLNSKILVFSSKIKNVLADEEVTLDERGYVLQPGKLYLGATEEIIGSSKYTMTLLGKSSIGRLGLFLNATADLGHVGAISQWTLEMSVTQPLKIYPFMQIGQIAFWVTKGDLNPYQGKYLNDLGPQLSKE